MRWQVQEDEVPTEPDERSCALPAGPRWHEMQSGGDSGKRLRQDGPARTPRWRPECRPPWAHAGSERQGGCRHRTSGHVHHRHRDDSCASPNGRRSPSSVRRAGAFVRSLVDYIEPRRRSHESSAETQPPEAAGSSTVPVPPSGMRIDPLAVPGPRSWPRTRRYEPT